MVENFLLEYDKESSYALVKLIDAEHMPYVVAYGYDTENRDWSQGHYYSKIEDAVARFNALKYDMCDWIDTLDVEHTDFGNARVVNVREITDDIDFESNEWCPAD